MKHRKFVSKQMLNRVRFCKYICLMKDNVINPRQNEDGEILINFNIVSFLRIRSYLVLTLF